MTAKKMTQKKRVLYYDDEPFISGALASSLELFDWDVTLVSEVNFLIEEVLDKPYDILILDIMAPIPAPNNEHFNFTRQEISKMREGMNTGLVLAEKIWTLEGGKLKNLPILFISARQKPDEINLFQEDGKICDVIRKPELAKTVNEKLEQLLNMLN